MAAPRYLTHNGITLTMGGWAQRLNIEISTISGRLLAGWPLERVLVAKPLKKKIRSHPVLRPELMAMQGRLSAEEYLALSSLVGDPHEAEEPL